MYIVKDSNFLILRERQKPNKVDLSVNILILLYILIIRFYLRDRSLLTQEGGLVGKEGGVIFFLI
jgi:hypothetical protein